MHCTSPKKAQYNRESKTLYFGPQNKNNMEPILLPCKKCMACKLEHSRETALRAIHELKTQDPSKCHFLTLTYSDKHVGDNVLNYRDIQLFIKRLRHQQNDLYLATEHPSVLKNQEIIKNISDRKLRKKLYKTHNVTKKLCLKNSPKLKYLVGGEYGEKRGRMHWHMLLFNVTLKDLVPIKIDDLGNQISKSNTIEVLWGKNDSEQCPNEIGNITLESAGYVARYTVKKSGDEKTIGNRSTRNPIGSEFLKRFTKDIFNYGKIQVDEITTYTIPRYYREWIKKNRPDIWADYESRILLKRQNIAKERSEKERNEYAKRQFARSRDKGLDYISEKTTNEMRKQILEQKFKKLKEHLKL